MLLASILASFFVPAIAHALVEAYPRAMTRLWVAGVITLAVFTAVAELGARTKKAPGLVDPALSDGTPPVQPGRRGVR